MAECPVAPRGSAANISRRTLLAALPGLSIAPTVAATPAISAWEKAAKAYAAAHCQCAAFAAMALQPAYDRYNADLDRASSSSSAEARGRLLRLHGIIELEDRGDDLGRAKHDALAKLLMIPAPDREALLLKVRLSYGEIFRHDDDMGLIQAIFADIERLCPVRADRLERCAGCL